MRVTAGAGFVLLHAGRGRRGAVAARGVAMTERSVWTHRGGGPSPLIPPTQSSFERWETHPQASAPGVRGGRCRAASRAAHSRGVTPVPRCIPPSPPRLQTAAQGPALQPLSCLRASLRGPQASPTPRPAPHVSSGTVQPPDASPQVLAGCGGF